MFIFSLPNEDDDDDDDDENEEDSNNDLRLTSLFFIICFIGKSLFNQLLPNIEDLEDSNKFFSLSLSNLEEEDNSVLFCLYNLRAIATYNGVIKDRGTAYNTMNNKTV